MSTILERYRGGGRVARLYRRLRLEHGGFEELAALLPTRGLIVDLGCGAGLLAHVLVAQAPGRRVLAVDHHEGRVRELARSAEGLAIEARLAAMEQVALPACAGIALIDVLHYLTADVQERLLARCARALEPGGVLVLRDPDAAAGARFAVARLHERLATRMGWTQASLGRYRSGAAWASLLRAHGLTPRVLPLPRWRPYADRIVVGRKP